DFPGVYTQNGQVMTYTQPPEELGAITAMPYEPRIPASSECQKFESATLYAALGSASATPTGSASGSAKPTGGLGGSNTQTTRSGTGTADASTQTGEGNGAHTVSVSLLSIVGVVLSAAFLS
ncbi:hypothetical protein PQX77_003067, partial [Marasmius sp. AFHP31]